MLLGEGHFPERVISINKEVGEYYDTEDRLDLGGYARIKRGSFRSAPLAGAIKGFIDQQRENIENGLIIANKELDGVPGEILEKVKIAHGEHTPDEKLLSLILDGAKSRVGTLKLKYREQANQFLKTIETKANWAAGRWLDKITSLRSYANLDEKLRKISKNFNNTVRKAEREQVKIFNGKFEDLRLEFEREMINFTLRVTTGKNIEEIISEYGEQDEYREKIDQLRNRFKRTPTGFDHPLVNFCYNRPWWESVLINIGTLGFCGGIGIADIITTELNKSETAKAIFDGIIIGGITIFRVATFSASAVWTGIAVPAMIHMGKQVLTQLTCWGLDELLIWTGAYPREISKGWATQEICNYGLNILVTAGQDLFKSGFKNLKSVLLNTATKTVQDNSNIAKISTEMAVRDVLEKIKGAQSNSRQ